MRKKGKKGFDYYLSEEVIKDYRKKSPELRLKWLYMGNLQRKGYPHHIIKRQERFRKGEI